MAGGKNMFIKLNIDVNGTVIEKTFDSLKSLKENVFFLYEYGTHNS